MNISARDMFQILSMIFMITAIGADLLAIKKLRPKQTYRIGWYIPILTACVHVVIYYIVVFYCDLYFCETWEKLFFSTWSTIRVAHISFAVMITNVARVWQIYKETMHEPK